MPSDHPCGNLMCEGVGIRATARLTGVNRKTVGKLALDIGKGACELHDRMMVSIRVNRLELDELWSFVGKKQRGHSTTPNLPPSARMADVLDFLRQEVYVRRDMLVPCRKAGKPRIFTPVREPSGESR
jgi:hypothetical protein